LAESVAQKAGEAVDRTAKKHSDTPDLVVTVDKMRVQGRLGFRRGARSAVSLIFE
jgi:hypothetical protein